MSISYSGIVGNKAKATYPSVETWGTDNNILRDPPKSIMTRRIDKVNQDGSLNEMFYHSGDRFAENIQLYARGVNPMVSVEYGNANVSGGGAYRTGGNGKLPYRIMNGGAFRPPQLRQEQLLPLSRLPRNVTFVNTSKEFKDYSKSALCDQQPKCYRQIKSNVLNSFVAPTKTMKIQTPIKEHFEVKYVVENPLLGEIVSNKSDRLADLHTHNPDFVKEAGKEINKYSYIANKSGESGQVFMHDDLELDSKTFATNTQTNKFINNQTGVKYEHDIILDKNIPEHYTRTNTNNNRNYTMIEPENEYEFESNMPKTSVISHLTSNARSSDILANSSRNASLHNALDVGGYQGSVGIPRTGTGMDYNSNYNTSKTQISQEMKKIYHS